MPENPEQPLETGEPLPSSRETSSDSVGGRSKSEFLFRLAPLICLVVITIVQTVQVEHWKGLAFKSQRIAEDAIKVAQRWQDLYEGKAVDLPRCATIHKPAAGCPAGYREVPDMFEKAGKKSAACLAPPEAKKEPCTDVLYPGESMNLTIRIPVPGEQEKVIRQ